MLPGVLQMGISWSFRITQRNPRKKQSLKAEKEKLGIPDWQGRSGKTILCREHHVIIIKDSFEALCFGKAESVSQFSHSVVSDSLWPHESQHARPPCPSPTLGVHSDSCPLSQWCYPAISSSVVPFSSCPQIIIILLPLNNLYRPPKYLIRHQILNL